MNEENNYKLKEYSTLTIVFIFIQIILVIIAIVSFSKLPKTDYIDGYERQEKMSISISNIAEKYPMLSRAEVTFIESMLFDSAKENSSYIALSDTEAEIRNETIHSQHFEEQDIDLISAIVDIPKLGQSYQLFYEHSNNENNEYVSPVDSTLFLCLDDEKLITYPDFNCRSKYDSSTRDMIVSKYLPYHNFEYFSANVETKNDTTRIAIQPISSDFSSSESRTYTKQVKDFIESLGISSERFTYDVINPEDFTFYQETD